MKFILLLTCLVLYVASIQGQRCRGSPLTVNCRGHRDSGHLNGRTCRSNQNNNMWYWDSSSRSCLSMSFLGCGGNNNRHCSQADCTRHCGGR